MRTPLTAWSRYVKNLFGSPRAVSPLRTSRGRRRQNAGGPGRVAAEVQVLEERTLLSGFTFAGFDSTNAAGLNLQGTAKVTTDNRLEITPAQDPAIGSAWYTAAKSVVAGNFQTTFQFQLATASGGSSGNDGFAFIIQNTSPSELHGIAGQLGYDGMHNSLAVEFDANQDGNYGDPSQSSISVHTGGMGANSVVAANSLGYYDTVPAGFLLDDAQVHTATISYTPGSLSVYLDGGSNPVLTVSVNLNTTLGLDHGSAWIGFTGSATGSAALKEDILNWSFSGDDDLVVAEQASVLEGAAGTQSTLLFTVDRVGSTAGPLTVNWNTADGTAHAGSDYIAASGQVTFADGQSQQTVAVTVNGNSIPGANKTLQLVLTPTAGVTIVSGQGTILNDDTAISVGNSTVVEGDTSTNFIDTFIAKDSGGMWQPGNIAIASNGDVYVASHSSDQVLRYDARGEFLGAVISRSDGLWGPCSLTFGPDGKLYAGAKWSQNVMTYDPATGLVASFVSSGDGGLNLPKGLAFGTDGNLYVGTGSRAGVTPPHNGDEVLRFQGPNGVSPGAPLPAPGQAGAVLVADPNPDTDDGLAGVAFGPDGKLYVELDNSINRYDPTTGAFLNTFVTSGSGGLNNPTALLFRPDGYLYVASQSGNQVMQYNATTGAFVSALMPAGDQNLNTPSGLAFDAAGNLYVNSAGTGGPQPSRILRYGPGSEAAYTVTLSAASAVPVTVDYSTANGTAMAGSDYVATSGTVTFAPGETTKTILVKTLSDGVSAGDKSFVVNLSNPTGGAVFTNTQGAGTIRDGETKFLVVDDGTTNRIFDYGSTGVSVGNTALSSGDTAPRGMASNAAGTRTWVVDANKNVYVYNAAGTLLGSWSPGSLKGTAVLDGLATNGTDVWLLDSKNGTGYRYTGAASRLSGSQNAASNFSLNSGNSNGKGIVTDGTSLWVVNDASSGSDKVFKYSLSGTLLGSWTIDAANAHPTGITIDPNNVSNIWIVDNVALKVFQYTGAATRISGSQSAAATFALAAGDSNPQDIADPPPAGLMQSIAPSLSGATSNGSPQPATGNPVNPGQTYSGFGLWSDGLFTFLGQNSDPADDDASGPLAGPGNSNPRGQSKVAHG